ncbi:hypothetical protein, partial [Rhizobium leguminosarum]|uniref:hypothetical protein n=1 Tax=Rhizobium leguminosarum TaxID=384 RepID=UPI003F97BA52
MSEAKIGWEWQVATMLIPAVIYGVMFLGQSFPKTERVTSGISSADMWKACASPLYLIMIFC